LPSPNWDKITRDFLVQFAGIFMSEGCLNAALSRGKTIAIRMTIKLRVDDLACLAVIQSLLGGAIRTWKRKGRHANAIWEVTKANDIQAILEAIRPLVFIPMKKAREFDVALEYFAWRRSVGFHRVDRATVLAFAEKLSALKRFQMGC
jgi:hypothetical protein